MKQIKTTSAVKKIVLPVTTKTPAIPKAVVKKTPISPKTTTITVVGDTRCYISPNGQKTCVKDIQLVTPGGRTIMPLDINPEKHGIMPLPPKQPVQKGIISLVPP